MHWIEIFFFTGQQLSNAERDEDFLLLLHSLSPLFHHSLFSPPLPALFFYKELYSQATKTFQPILKISQSMKRSS